MSQSESSYSEQDKQALLKLVRDAIDIGLQTGSEPKVHTHNFATHLQAKRATFVTLKMGEQLRGCIGSLQATRPLVEDVAYNAWAAAFRDPRFVPVSQAEFAMIEPHISILSPPEPMTFKDEADLVSQIRPNVDGLILIDGGSRGTFLPSVWEQLPDVQSFWSRLKQKAGLPTDHWSSTLRVERYTAESIP